MYFLTAGLVMTPGILYILTAGLGMTPGILYTLTVLWIFDVARDGDRQTVAAHCNVVQ